MDMLIIIGIALILVTNGTVLCGLSNLRMFIIDIPIKFKSPDFNLKEMNQVSIKSSVCLLLIPSILLPIGGYVFRSSLGVSDYLLWYHIYELVSFIFLFIMCLLVIAMLREMRLYLLLNLDTEYCSRWLLNNLEEQLKIISNQIKIYYLCVVLTVVQILLTSLIIVDYFNIIR